MFNTIAATVSTVRTKMLGTSSPDGLVVWAMILGAVIALIGNGHLPVM